MADLKIQSDYWEGTECLANEVPWQVPSSIIYENEILLPGDRVAEIGCGGSTLFFARRCMDVVAIETDAGFAFSVSSEALRKNIQNVRLVVATTGENESKSDAIVRAVQSLPDGCFDVISVDPMHDANRSEVLTVLLEKCKTVRVVVLDNYADSLMFPGHWNKSQKEMIEEMPGGGVGWECQVFNDDKWVGKGTMILSRKASH